MSTAGAEFAVYDCIVVNATDRRGSGGVAIWHAVALPVLCAQTVTWRRVDNDTASDVTASSCAVLAPLLRRIGCGGNRQKHKAIVQHRGMPGAEHAVRRNAVIECSSTCLHLCRWHTR